MRTAGRRLIDLVMALVVWVFVIHDLTKYIGSPSWRWSIGIVASICTAFVINRALVSLYARYGPDRLQDSTTHLMPPADNRDLSQ